MSIVDITTLQTTAAAVTLTPALSGRTFIAYKQTAGTIITLPSPLNGRLYYRIINKNVTAHIMRFTSTGANMQAQWRDADGASDGGLSTTIEFTGLAFGGDSIELISDGVNWYANGSTGDADGIALG